MLVTSALLSVGTGTIRSSNADAIANRASKKSYKPNTQYEVGETLATFGVHLDLLVQNGYSGHLSRVDACKNSLTRKGKNGEAWYVQGSIGVPLPY